MVRSMRSWVCAGICPCVMLVAVLLTGGCSNGDGKKGGDDDDHHHHGAHPTVGPNGGPIIEWGEHKHHLEITFDREKQQATVYMLDHDMKKPEPTAVSTPELNLDGVGLIPLTPLPLEGESTEKASRYVATDAALGKAEAFSGVVSGKVGGTQYFGQFKEGDAKKGEAHDEHDEHDGDHKDHKDHDEGDDGPHGEHEAEHKDDATRSTGDDGQGNAK